MLLHCIVTPFSLILLLTEQAQWQGALNHDSDQLPISDKQANDETKEQVIKPLIFTVLSVGVILDLLACCKRWVADLLLYHELLVFLIHGLVPFEFGNFSHVTLLGQVVLIYLCYATNVQLSPLACTVCLAVREFCMMPLMYAGQNNAITNY